MQRRFCPISNSRCGSPSLEIEFAIEVDYVASFFPSPLQGCLNLEAAQTEYKAERNDRWIERASSVKAIHVATKLTCYAGCPEKAYTVPPIRNEHGIAAAVHLDVATANC